MPSFDPKAVGLRLQALREHHGMTRADFAASVEIDATSYGKIEKGDKPLKAEMAYRIAEKWAVTMEYLYRGRLTEIPPKLADSLIKNIKTLDE